MKKEIVMLTNLNCPTCAADIEKAFKKMPGVKSASVAFATGSLSLEYDESQVDSKQIERTVEDFGASIASRM